MTGLVKAHDNDKKQRNAIFFVINTVDDINLVQTFSTVFDSRKKVTSTLILKRTDERGGLVGGCQLPLIGHRPLIGCCQAPGLWKEVSGSG